MGSWLRDETKIDLLVTCVNEFDLLFTCLDELDLLKGETGSLASVVVATSSALFASNLATPDKLASALFIFHHRLCFEAAAAAKEVATIPPTALSAASATSRPHNSCHWVLCTVIRAWLDVDKALLVYRKRLWSVL